MPDPSLVFEEPEGQATGRPRVIPESSDSECELASRHSAQRVQHAQRPSRLGLTGAAAAAQLAAPGGGSGGAARREQRGGAAPAAAAGVVGARLVIPSSTGPSKLSDMPAPADTPTYPAAQAAVGLGASAPLAPREPAAPQPLPALSALLPRASGHSGGSRGAAQQVGAAGGSSGNGGGPASSFNFTEIGGHSLGGVSWIWGWVGVKREGPAPWSVVWLFVP